MHSFIIHILFQAWCITEITDLVRSFFLTHTSTHTHTQIHTYMHTQTHTRARTHTHVHTRAHSHSTYNCAHTQYTLKQ